MPKASASPTLDGDATQEMVLWLNTFSKPEALRNDPAAADLEMRVLEEALAKAGATSPSRVRSVFARIKQTATHRAWPTARQIVDAAADLRGHQGQDAIGSQGGDRSKLSHDELRLLETQVLPTARAWLDIPGLRQHGRQTLEYWGEAE